MKLGDCYKAAAEYVLAHPEATLVHGWPSLQVEPFCRFDHAWAEFVHPATGEKMVKDVSNGGDIEIPRTMYYDLGKIKVADCLIYDRPHAVKMLVDFRHWGPWTGVNGCGPLEGARP